MERAMEDTRKVQETSMAGVSLERVRQQLQDWRAGRKLGERIPAPLWAAAVGAAREQQKPLSLWGQVLRFAYPCSTRSGEAKDKT